MLSLEKEFKEKLQAIYKSAPLDALSFHRMYKACALSECFGMCCNGGSDFYLSEEAETIRRVVNRHGEFFAAQNLPLPEKIFAEERDEETGEIYPSTNTRRVTYPEGLLPAHFPPTACIFRNDAGACTLQTLGIEQDKGGWWYKPFACWLFPIKLRHGGKPLIHVAHASTDKYADEDYPGFVGYAKCGAECKNGGKPAYEVLAQEIAALSNLLGRDLMSEMS
jgi:hypothetical protein